MSDVVETLSAIKRGTISLEEGVRRIKAARARAARGAAPAKDEARIFRVQERPVDAEAPDLRTAPDAMRVVATGPTAWALLEGWRDASDPARHVDAVRWEGTAASGGLAGAPDDPFGGRRQLVVVDDLGAEAAAPGEAIAARASGLFAALMRAARAAAAGRTSRAIAFLGVHAGDVTPPHQAAVESLFRTLARELPSVRFRWLAWRVDEGSPREGFARALAAVVDGSEPFALLRGGRLLAPVLEEDGVRPSAALPVSNDDAFLVTGGAGRLGMVVARELARAGAAVVLAGRAPPSAAIEARLRELAELGARTRYVAADLGDPAAVRGACQDAIAAFGKIDGVFHLAGVTADGLAATKDLRDSERVLGPKVAGTVALDEALRGQPLRLFVGFSSTSSVFGNVGQADYAFANGFLDAWTQWRAAGGGGSGTSLSICWPLWQDGGMRAPEENVRRWRDRFGLSPMPAAAGSEVLRTLLASAARGRVVVLHGDPGRLGPAAAEQLAAPREPPAAATGPDHAGVRAGASPAVAPEVLAAAVDLLKRSLAEETRTPLDRVDAGRPLADYGLDSTMILDITARLEATFGELPKTLLYEYATIDDLADHLARAYGGKLRARSAPAVPAAPDGARPVRTLLRRAEATAGGYDADDVAIVGVAGRYPASPDLDAFWLNLRNGVDCIREIPKSRWDVEQLGFADRMYCKWGGFLDDVALFEPRLFNITPSDARMMDPQQRLFLETVHELLEDAGYARDALGGTDRSVGVFVGVMWAEYSLIAAEAGRACAPETPRAQFWEIPNRVSYCFDFRGPSVAVDTACSSSLTALHYAVESIRGGSCAAAIVGGVNLSLHPSKYIALCEGKYAAAHGRCKSFGSDGNGYVPGEGVGAVLLKPLRRALADGDHVRAVIRGTAVNHGGRQSRFTVPSPTAQAALIARALERARVAPEAVGYVEAHGTGTRLGDPIEIRGLADAFDRRGGRTAPCPVGSVKSNIGHLEAAAGVAGLTKVLLQMKHGELVPSLHCDVENAEVGFERTPFFVQKMVAPWPLPPRDAAGARIAAVSAFGAGGSNAHVVVEQWIDPDPREPVAEGAAPEAFVFSARTASSLERYLRRMLAFLQRTRVDLADAAYTLAVGRDARQSRIAFLARSQDELVATVERALEAGVTAEQLRSRAAAAAAEAGTPCRHPRLDVDLAPTVARWVAGERVDWASIHARDPVRRRRIPLPTYCFDRERYWIV